MSVLGNGITALNAFRTQLVTTSHNIANVNTEGYSRQVVELGTMPESPITAGYLGNGVQVEGIKRQFDQFLMDRVRSYTSGSEDYQVFLDRASRVDDILADPDSGLSQAMQSFFNSVQDVADDPTSTATRSVMLSSANILANRFYSVYEFLESMRTEINQDMKVLVNEANTLGESIALINTQIEVALGQSGGQPPNDLLDRRDVLITELSKLVNVTAVESGEGAVNVFIGSGQALVIGSKAFNLDTTVNEAEPDRINITLEAGGGISNDITSSLSGGKLGGYFRFRNDVLDPTSNALGRLAMGLGSTFNDQHKLGMDLNGELGRDFFTVPDVFDTSSVQSMVLANPLNNGGLISITGIDEANLTTSDYELKYNGTSWEITDRQTGTTTNQLGGGNITFGGLTIDVNVAPATNDSYIIRPTRQASRSFAVEILDGKEIAAASPISVSAGNTTLNPPSINSGTASISNSGLISPLSGTDISGVPITITYDDTIDTFIVSGGHTLSPNTYADDGSDSRNTYELTINGLGTFAFALSGIPSNGDVFTFGDNTGGVGDNRNMRKLADFQFEKTMLENTSGNATTSFSGLYSNLIGEVGSKTRQGIINNDTQIKLKEQAVTSLDSISGVNLDEEAASLVTFQQAYQAASQIIRISNTLFDSLLNSVR